MLIPLVLGLAEVQVSEPEVVFQSQALDATAKFETYRIPALAMTRRGTLLAFAEGRQSVHDQAANTLVLRRKLKNGQSWEPMQVVFDWSPASLNNPTVLVGSSGRIWLMFQMYPKGIGEYTVQTGFDPLTTNQSFLSHSDDDGKTWSQPKDLTRIVKRPEVKTIASGPGIGIELTRGKHRGRLLFPFNEREGSSWTTYSVFSDDKGVTWQRGALTPKPEGTHPNEVQFSELADGSVLLNARNQASARQRLQAVSTDGGATWSSAELRPDLIDPVCMGSVIRVGFKPDLLALSNPESATSRTNGVLKLSRDGGKTWAKAAVIDAGSFAYSSLVALSEKKIGVLYEQVKRVNGREGYSLLYRQIALP